MSAEQGIARGNAMRAARAKIVAYRRHLAGLTARQLARTTTDPDLARQLADAYATALRRRQERAEDDSTGEPA
jgi:hypothetical protein